ncbi:MAG: DNA-processing protein DprA [Patescibacteria group bacterium]|jgi:DNA processing protein
MKSDFENNYYLFLFSKIQGLGSKNILKLLEKFPSPKELYKILLANPKILGDKLNHILQDKNFLSQTKEYFRNLDEKYISILDSAYPQNLKNIYDPPLFLFYQGNVDLLKSPNLVTIVGSRTTTDYHRHVLKNIFKDLCDTPLVIVSGLAVGIDTFSHRLALDHNLATIAVLGSGLNKYVLYPHENIKLAQEIIAKGGLLISEQSSNTKTQLYHFPKRNRILAGLSKATVVISGAQKSGTLITAQVAIDEGREVLALPGNINLRLSQGPNKLIKQGAAIIDCAEDIFKIYNLNKDLKISKTLFKNKYHAKIYSTLQTEPMKLVELTNLLGVSIADTSSLISEMEIRGLIKLNNLNQLEII